MTSPADHLLRAAIDELLRLARETAERTARGAYLAAMASVAAIEPLRNLLIEQLSSAWSSSIEDDPCREQGPPSVASVGYL
jgi:hypothetical protein